MVSLFILHWFLKWSIAQRTHLMGWTHSPNFPRNLNKKIPWKDMSLVALVYGQWFKKSMIYILTKAATQTKPFKQAILQFDSRPQNFRGQSSSTFIRQKHHKMCLHTWTPGRTVIISWQVPSWQDTSNKLTPVISVDLSSAFICHSVLYGKHRIVVSLPTYYFWYYGPLEFWRK